MVKIKIIWITLISCTIMSCSQGQNFGPGYQFDLFKNSPNWQLAQAVKIQDTNAIKRLLTRNKLNINLQEPKFGRTLLLLAVGNDKLYSTKALLENGANINISDFEKNKPIHEATRFISLKKNALEILKLLIRYGANVNDTLIKTKGRDTTYFYLPMMGASECLSCAKLLIENGANLYIKNNTSCCGTIYAVWSAMLEHNELYDNIYVAKYVIVDRKIPIPKYIVYNMPNKNPVDIYYYLNYKKFENPQKEKVRQEILGYLQRIGFPKKDSY